MARKVSHHRNILSKEPIKMKDIQPGNIIEFTYSGKNIYDTKPMVFVLADRGMAKSGMKSTKKLKVGKSGILHGINVSYMKEHVVHRLLEETNFKKLKYYSLYEKAFRTYNTKKMNMIKLVEFKKEAVSTETKVIEKKEKRIDDSISRTESKQKKIMKDEN